MGIAEIRGEKIGGGVGERVPDHLGQTNYSELCILVFKNTKYISKLNRIQNTNYMPCMYLVTYFKYLYFNYLTTLQTNTQNNLGFSHALTAARAL